MNRTIPSYTTANINHIKIDAPSPLALSLNLSAVRNAIDVKIKVRITPSIMSISKGKTVTKEIPFNITPSNVPDKNPSANGIELPKNNPTNKDFRSIGWHNTICI